MIEDIIVYTKDLHSYLNGLGNEEVACAQSKYMRNRFPFFGIKQGLRKKYWKEFQEKNGSPAAEEVIPFMFACIEYPERELWYIALDHLMKHKNKISSSNLGDLKRLIISSDWWDVVDMVASNLVGTLAQRYPETRTEIDSWIDDENFWLRRTAIIYQLKFDAQTNEAILYDHIRKTSHEKEFFIRKAIGWSLRQYAKFNPNSVRTFVANAELSALSKKEAFKYL
jgi:3-methyladenine DNA glycosylase AlkD